MSALAASSQWYRAVAATGGPAIRQNGNPPVHVDEQDSHVQTTTNSGTSKKPRRRVSQSRVQLLAVIPAAAVSLFTSNDWCFAALTAFLVALASVWLIEMLLWDTFLPDSRQTDKVRMISAILIGVVAGAAFRVYPGWAFDTAFGIQPPSGIEQLRMVRHYEGGPGEHTLILEFHADQTTIDTLLAKRPFTFGEEAIGRYRSLPEDVDVWSRVAPFGPFGRSSWNRIRPITDPTVFSWHENAEETVVLWNPDSGRVVVIHTRS